MLKIKAISILIILLVQLLPGAAAALSMPQNASQLAEAENFTARSYVVFDKLTGQTLLSKEPDLVWPPASLTKLVTALVVLDTKPKLTKVVAITKADQEVGGCSIGGACLSTKPGIKYTVNNLFYASLLASANNATNALARSTGMSAEKFAAKMNEKAKSLGATNTHFNEPTGMDPENYTTAGDYIKIAQAAFADPYIHKIDTTKNYNFYAYNSKKYYHKLKNTDKLLGDADLTIMGGKTGFLDESQYNFVTELKDRLDNNFLVALFGSQSSTLQFSETKKLAQLAGLSKLFDFNKTLVLGTSTITTVKN